MGLPATWLREQGWGSKGEGRRGCRDETPISFDLASIGPNLAPTRPALFDRCRSIPEAAGPSPTVAASFWPLPTPP
jgi:hypothetical protein